MVARRFFFVPREVVQVVSVGGESEARGGRILRREELCLAPCAELAHPEARLPRGAAAVGEVPSVRRESGADDLAPARHSRHPHRLERCLPRHPGFPVPEEFIDPETGAGQGKCRESKHSRY